MNKKLIASSIKGGAALSASSEADIPSVGGINSAMNYYQPSMVLFS